MLLRHTPKEIKERTALTVNPAKTCQPVGAMYAALGIHGCLPHSHGSQGCCSYHRTALTRHYKEPVMAATSSFTEGSSVFGGQANLLQAINNIFTIYDPEVIAVHSTCLSETIGDDLKQIAEKAKDDGKVPAGKKIIYANTPSYVGSHVTGYANMVTSMVKQLAESTGKKKDRINLIPGWVEPADMAEIKRLAGVMGVKYTMFPDTSKVCDTPMTGHFEMYPQGGTPMKAIEESGDSKATLAMGDWATKDAAIAMENKCKVPFKLITLPIGLSATDRFISAMSELAAVSVPAEITWERGRLVDLITDMHQYLYNKRVALFGDPDQLIPMVEFLLDLDMKPVYVVSGTPGKRFTKTVTEMLEKAGVKGFQVRNGEGADMFLMHQWIKNEGVDLLIGNTYGKYIARDENIPFLRHGFPIMDRVGHTFFTTAGYQGAIRMVDQMLELFMDKQDAEAPESSFELQM